MPSSHLPPPSPSSNPASLAPPVPNSPGTSPNSASLVPATLASRPRPVSSTLLLVPGGPSGSAIQSLPPSDDVAHPDGDAAAPVDAVHYADDDVDAAVGAAAAAAVAVVAPFAIAVGFEIVADAFAVSAVVPVAAGAGSVTHTARGECWVQRVSKSLKEPGVVVAAVAGDGDEIVWFGTTSYVNGRIVAADLVRGFSARLEKLAAKTAGENSAAT